MKQHITDKIKEGISNQIKQVAGSISKNIDDGRKIWGVKWNVKRKDEIPLFIITSEGREM